MSNFASLYFYLQLIIKGCTCGFVICVMFDHLPIHCIRITLTRAMCSTNTLLVNSDFICTYFALFLSVHVISITENGDGVVGNALTTPEFSLRFVTSFFCLSMIKYTNRKYDRALI